MLDISIHAPPRGATGSRGHCVQSPEISIHAPPRGATREGITFVCKKKFQFTPLREGRPFATSESPGVGNFNSRPSARGDWTIEPQDERKLISIHAPPRGATGVSFSCLLWLFISIHAPPRGATGCGVVKRLHSTLFQFTPLREGRRPWGSLSFRRRLFQFTPLREGRR